MSIIPRIIVMDFGLIMSKTTFSIPWQRTAMGHKPGSLLIHPHLCALHIPSWERCFHFASRQKQFNTWFFHVGHITTHPLGRGFFEHLLIPQHPISHWTRPTYRRSKAPSCPMDFKMHLALAKVFQQTLFPPRVPPTNMLPWRVIFVSSVEAHDAFE